MEKGRIARFSGPGHPSEEQARSFIRLRHRNARPGGAAMFQELAAFEGHHRDRLVALRDSLRKADTWIEYKGRDLSKRPTAEAAGRSGVDERNRRVGRPEVAIERGAGRDRVPRAGQPDGGSIGPPPCSSVWPGKSPCTANCSTISTTP